MRRIDSVKILSILTLLALVSVVNAPGVRADTKPIYPGSTCVSNGFLSANISNATDSNSGIYTFATGGCPITESTGNPNLILFPQDSYNTIRVDDTHHDYVPVSLSNQSPFTTISLGSQSPTNVAHTSTLYDLGWTTTAEHLGINQVIEVQGATAADSRIRMTLNVTNHDTSAHTVEMRDFLDLFVGDYDGTWIRLYTGTTPGPITGIEEDFRPPFNFTAFSMSGCTSDPCTPGNYGVGTFTLFSSISAPAGSTTPSRYVYGWWRAMTGTTFNYTSVPRQIGSTTKNVDGTADSAELYYFPAITLNPGDSTAATIFISNSTEAITQPSNIKLSPLTATNNVGTSHTVTATVTDNNGAALPGVTVSFNIVSGPNAGITATGVTDSNGNVTFTYTDTGGAGTDTIVASFHDATGGLHTSNTVTKNWTSGIVIPEVPYGTLLTILLPLTALVIYTKRHSITLR